MKRKNRRTFMAENENPTGSNNPEITNESLKGLAVFRPSNQNTSGQKNSPVGSTGGDTEKK
jgi:hypothetical protein